MGRPRKESGLYQCTEGFGYTLEDGSNDAVSAGELADAGHPVLKGHEWAFAPAKAGRFAWPPNKADKPAEEEAEPEGEDDA